MLRRIIFLFVLFLFSCQNSGGSKGNGYKTFKFWEKQGGNVAFFYLNKKDDSIVAQLTDKAAIKTDSYLVLEGNYSDFELELSFKASDIPVGIFFRSSFQKLNKLGHSYNKITGYKCYIDPTGKDTGFVSFVPLNKGEDWLSPRNKEKKVFKKLKWNNLRINAFAGKIKVYVNNTLVSDFRNSRVASGRIALQFSAAKNKTQLEQKTYFKNITIKKLLRQ